MYIDYDIKIPEQIEKLRPYVIKEIPYHLIDNFDKPSKQYPQNLVHYLKT